MRRAMATAAMVCLMASMAAAQSPATTQAADDTTKKADEWAASLKLDDAAKTQRVADLIATHLRAVKAWHDAHPFTTVPSGINLVSGKPMSDLDRQVIADSSLPKETHAALIDGLKAELTPEQVEAVLDRYTVGKVAFTLQGYKAIVPDLTGEEEAQITAYLKEARERAIDQKSMKGISAVFEIYKTKCEQMLNANGRSWKALYKAFQDKLKVEKAEKAAATQPK